jgi:CRISPR/Cas system-associated endonuclease Cas3-HD
MVTFRAFGKKSCKRTHHLVSAYLHVTYLQNLNKLIDSVIVVLLVFLTRCNFGQSTPTGIKRAIA